MILSLLLIFLIVVGSLLYSITRPKNFPPGPTWYPVVGCLPHVKKLTRSLGGQHVALSRLSDELKSNVVGLKLGEQLLVGVSSGELLRKLFASEDYDARPNNFFAKLRNVGTKPGITCAEGPLWHEQRKFIVRHLRDVGFGRKVMELKIKEEFEDVAALIEVAGCDVEVGSLLPAAVMNVLWCFVAGTRFSRNDPRFNELINLLDKRIRAFDMAGGILSQYPWLRFVAPERIGYNLINRLNGQLRQFLMEAIEDHHENWTAGNDSDLMYAFISEMKKTTNGHPTNFTNDQLLMICVDLFVAGAHTTSGTLSFVYIMMLLHPDVQAKAQKELDAVFGKDDAISFSDRHEVPYIDAILWEVMRYCSSLPIGGSRRTLRKTMLDGYVIPKDTTVLINLWSVMVDPKIWGDPEVFRPERFIDDKGRLICFKAHTPFGYGKRRCLGQSLARSFLFIFLAETLRKYTISPVPGAPLPSVRATSGIVTLPQNYSARFSKRRN